MFNQATFNEEVDGDWQEMGSQGEAPGYAATHWQAGAWPGSLPLQPYGGIVPNQWTNPTHFAVQQGENALDGQSYWPAGYVFVPIFAPTMNHTQPMDYGWSVMPPTPGYIADTPAPAAHVHMANQGAWNAARQASVSPHMHNQPASSMDLGSEPHNLTYQRSTAPFSSPTWTPAPTAAEEHSGNRQAVSKADLCLRHIM